MKGAGTKDDDLIRLLVCRAEVFYIIYFYKIYFTLLIIIFNKHDLAGIKFQYKALYGKSLYDAVKSELSGEYEKLFLALIGQ